MIARLTPKFEKRRPKKGPKKGKDVHWGDRLFFWGLRLMAFLILALLLAIAANLVQLGWPALSRFGFSFFTSQEWDPVSDHYGAVAFAFGTIVSSMLALLISVPISVASSLFLTEIASKRTSAALSFLIEMLAAIPSVVYGLWGIFVLAPLMRNYFQPFLSGTLGFLPIFQGPAYGVGMLTAGIILAIMITPTITTICREVFRAIPDSQREAALGLGATRYEMVRMAVLSSSTSGIVGAVVLGLGRALGETMAVTMVIGNRVEISTSLFAPAQTMASVIANEYAEATSDIHLSSLAAVGLALFIVALIVNSLARALIWNVERTKGVSK